jgi:drug/metabolite transporter (DMT)-like permease
MSDDVTAGGWIKGIALSVLASIIGGASKLAIRRSWLIEASASRNDALLAESRDPQSQDLEISYESMSDEEDNTSLEAYECKRIKRIAKSLRLCGLVGMTFLNPLCCVLAMNYASPSILAPFSGLTLVWIILLSGPVIHEAPSYQQFFAAILVIAGEGFVGAFGDHKNDDNVTLEELRDSYRNPWFISFLILLAFWMLLLTYWVRRGSCTYLKFAWGAAGGSITGQQNWLKDCLTILKASHGSLPWYLPVMALLAIVTAFVGLLLLTACMKRYDATYSSAMFVGSFVISASLMSAVHYDTFGNLENVYDYSLYPIGLGILMVGIFILVHETTDSVAETDDVIPLVPSEAEEEASLSEKSKRSLSLETDYTT